MRRGDALRRGGAETWRSHRTGTASFSARSRRTKVPCGSGRRPAGGATSSRRPVRAQWTARADLTSCDRTRHRPGGGAASGCVGDGYHRAPHHGQVDRHGSGGGRRRRLRRRSGRLAPVDGRRGPLAAAHACGCRRRGRDDRHRDPHLGGEPDPRAGRDDARDPAHRARCRDRDGRLAYLPSGATSVDEFRKTCAHTAWR